MSGLHKQLSHRCIRGYDAYSCAHKHEHTKVTRGEPKSTTEQQLPAKPSWNTRLWKETEIRNGGLLLSDHGERWRSVWRS